MLDTIAGSAFTLGILSAVSLPVGATTANFWRPEDPVIAVAILSKTLKPGGGRHGHASQQAPTPGYEQPAPARSLLDSEIKP